MADDSPNTAPAPMIDPALMNQLRQQMTQRRELAPMSVSPGAKRLGFGETLGMGLMNMFVPFLGTAMASRFKAQKENQINEAMNEAQVMHNVYEDAYQMALQKSGGDPEKAKELANQLADKDPRMVAMFDGPAGKKRLKNWSKVFSVDWVNPEKAQNTPHYQGLQKFMHVNPASKLMHAMGGLIGKRQQDQQGQQGQGQQGQGTPGLFSQLPQNLQQPDPKVIESNLNMQRQQLEFQMNQARMKEQFAQTLEERQQYHEQTLELRGQMVDMQKTNAENLHEYRMQSLQDRSAREQENARHNKEMETIARDRIAVTKELGSAREQENARHNKEMETIARDRIAVTKELGQVRNEIAQQRLDNATGGKLKTEYKSGLNVLHVSLFGSPDGKTPGLVDTLGVFDSPNSRIKLALSKELSVASGTELPGVISSALEYAKSSALSEDERRYVRQYARALGAINSLRSVTGLPRSTQTLMLQYAKELPNATVDKSSAEAMDRLMLIQREINAALADAAGKPAEGQGDTNVPDVTPKTDINDPLTKYKVKKP